MMKSAMIDSCGAGGLFCPIIFADIRLLASVGRWVNKENGWIRIHAFAAIYFGRLLLDVWVHRLPLCLIVALLRWDELIAAWWAT